MRAIPCRHFNFGEGTCPFGSSCFYAHTDRNGRPIVLEPRKAYAQTGATVLPSYRLSDYLFPETEPSGRALLDSIPLASDQPQPTHPTIPSDQPQPTHPSAPNDRPQRMDPSMPDERPQPTHAPILDGRPRMHASMPPSTTVERAIEEGLQDDLQRLTVV